jgi:hypothetical protein
MEVTVHNENKMEVIYNEKSFGLTSTIWKWEWWWCGFLCERFIVEIKHALWIRENKNNTHIRGHYAECTLDAIPLRVRKKFINFYDDLHLVWLTSTIKEFIQVTYVLTYTRYYDNQRQWIEFTLPAHKMLAGYHARGMLKRRKR